MPEPVYINAFKSGLLEKTAEKLFSSLSSCAICPRRCKVDRLKNETGFCKTASKVKVFSFMVHHGEEPPVSGTRGSGTIFFSNCNMGCVYCQNYEFSQLGQGKEYSCEELAGIMLELQEKGCHNINLVTPTHVLPQILKSLQIAASGGLNIPLVYNTGGYELPQIIRMLDGIVDVYLADSRYGQNISSALYSAAPDYVKYNREALAEMYRQAPEAEFDSDGLIKRGLIIRHLVLPNGVSGTREVMEFIAANLSPQVHISLMSQYLPYFKAKDFPQISRRLNAQEYEQAKQVLEELGMDNGWIQESYGEERFAGVHIKPK